MPDCTLKTRDKNGRWKAGVSGNPKGRPISNPARQLLLSKSEELVKKTIEKAMEGDVGALNVCLSRIVPQYRPQQAPINLDLSTADSLFEIGQIILTATADGHCPPDVAAQLLPAIGTLARVAEIEKLKDRLVALERAINPNKKRGDR